MITHLNKKNKPTMVDISKKKITSRICKAQGIVKFSKNNFNKIKLFNSKKGEIINTAILSGILGAKKTSELIPLCHNINLENIEFDTEFKKNLYSLIIYCTVKTDSKTGAEMEALTGVSVACLTIYDMCKSIDNKIKFENIKIIKKTGGKSDFSNK